MNIDATTARKRKKNINATNIVYDLLFCCSGCMQNSFLLVHTEKCSGGLINTCTSLTKCNNNELLVTEDKKSTHHPNKSNGIFSVRISNENLRTRKLSIRQTSHSLGPRIVYSDANNLTILQLYNFCQQKRYWVWFARRWWEESQRFLSVKWECFKRHENSTSTNFCARSDFEMRELVSAHKLCFMHFFFCSLYSVFES